MTLTRWRNSNVLRLFPWVLKDGRVVVNEMCRCGHVRTRHYDTLSPGHGQCLSCQCPRFTWVKHIFSSVTKEAR